MAGPKRVPPVFILPLLFLSFLSLHSAEAHRKISPSKLPNRVLMGAQSSSPTFYNAFDPSFQNPASSYTNNLNSKEHVDFRGNSIKDDGTLNHKDTSVDFNHKDSVDKGFDSTNNNHAFFHNTYNNKYDNNENFAHSTTSDYKANEGRYTHPTFPSYGRKFPTTFEASFPSKESYPSSTSQYSTPFADKSLYTSPSHGESSLSKDQSLYASPSYEETMYASPSNERSSHSPSPSNYKANYPFTANDSPSMSKVTELDEFTKSHPVSNYDSFFNTPTITKNLAHTSPLGHPTFPSSDHDLTYGQVQVP